MRSRFNKRSLHAIIGRSFMNIQMAQVMQACLKTRQIEHIVRELTGIVMVMPNSSMKST